MRFLQVLIVLLSVLGSSTIHAQISFNEFPEDMQLYSRNANDEGEIEISGEMTTSEFDEVLVKTYKGDSLYSQQRLTALESGSEINFNIPVEAGLVEYSVEFWLQNQEKTVLLKKAEKVLCGDTFVIYGQSNAVSYANYWVLNDSISKKYTRNYIHYFQNSHNDNGWHDGTFPEVGSLGKWFMKAFTEEIKVPILIINASLGGTNLEYLTQRNPQQLHDVHTPYGLMLKRIIDSKVKSIKGFIFLQGESEANTSLQDVEGYPALFDAFKNNLSIDIPPVDRYYVYQLGVMNTHALWEAGKLREYKRSLTSVYDDISVVPATGIAYYDFDGLHYSLDGYGTLANWLFNSYLAFEEGRKEFETPDLKKLINLRDEKKLKLIFNQEITVKDSISFGYYNSLMKDHFYSGRASGFINSIERSGKNIYLNYDELPSNSLTYLPGFFNDIEGKPYGGPFIKNRLGTPALTFYEVKIQNELPEPLVDNSNSNANSVQLFINESRAIECKGCQLEISYLTENGRMFLKSVPSVNLKPILVKNDFEDLNDSSVLILRYISPLSESPAFAYSLSGEEVVDSDKDGIPDIWDNCNERKNFEQADFDEDGVGDTCDDDADGDLVLDDVDDCLLQVNPQKPELVVKDGNKIYSSIPANQYHWVVNGTYSETTNDNLYIVRDSAEYAVYIGDVNGCSSLVSGSLSVSGVVLGTQEQFKSVVYPIPATQSLNYSFPHGKAQRVHLYTVGGRFLKAYKMNGNDGRIDLSGISEGVYVLIFLDKDNNRLKTQKIVKSN